MTVKLNPASGIADTFAMLVTGATIDFGFKLPVVITAVQANGTVIVDQFSMADGEKKFENLLERTAKGHDGQKASLPINFMVVDAEGSALRAFTCQHGHTTWIHEEHEDDHHPGTELQGDPHP